MADELKPSFEPVRQGDRTPKKRRDKGVFDLSSLTLKEREDIARLGTKQAEAGFGAKGGLPDRWSANEEVYDCSRRAVTVQIIPGGTMDDRPVWQPKCDRIVGTVFGQLTALDIVVQCIDEKGGGNAEDVEIALMLMATDGKLFSRYLRPAIEDACNTNCGLLTVQPRNVDGKTVGIEFTNPHPRDVFVYPAEITDIDECTSIGRRFGKRVWQINESIASGFYDDPGKKVMGGDPWPGESYTERGGTTDMELLEPTDDAEIDDANVELIEVLARLSLPLQSWEGYDPDDRPPRRWYKMTVAPTQMMLLKIEPYAAVFEGDGEPPLDYPDGIADYEDPWFVPFRLKPQRDNFWTTWALANCMQTFQNDINSIIETCIQGSVAGAFPIIFVTGGSMSGRSYRLNPGDVIELAGGPDVKVQVVQNSFRPGELQNTREVLEEMSDAASGISRLGTSEPLPASTSATAAAGQLQAQQQAKNDYSDSIEPSLERIWAIMFRYLQIHAEDLIDANRGRFPDTITPERVRSLKLRYKVTGSTPDATPQGVINKLIFVMQMLAPFLPGLDRTKVADKVFQLLEMPFTLDSILQSDPQLHPQVINLLQHFGFDPTEIEQALTLLNHQQQMQALAQQQMGQQPQHPLPRKGKGRKPGTPPQAPSMAMPNGAPQTPQVGGPVQQ